jgi:hypothetical protein
MKIYEAGDAPLLEVGNGFLTGGIRMGYVLRTY